MEERSLCPPRIRGLLAKMMRKQAGTQPKALSDPQKHWRTGVAGASGP